MLRILVALASSNVALDSVERLALPSHSLWMLSWVVATGRAGCHYSLELSLFGLASALSC